MREHSIHPSHFGKNIWDALKLTDVEVKEDGGRKSCKVVIETVVTRGKLAEKLCVDDADISRLLDMLNPGRSP